MSGTATAEPGEVFLNTDTGHLAALARQIMDGNADLATIAGITEDEIEAIYTVGHNFYGNGQYQDAIDIFRFLCMHRHMDARFWFGLGASCQLVKDHATAVKAYQTCAMLNLEDAQVSLRAAECFAALGDEEKMRQALDATVLVAEQFPGANGPFAARAKLMLARLDSQAAPA